MYSRVLKKSSQELYGLICYAELRKKVGGCKYTRQWVLLIKGGTFLVFAHGDILNITFFDVFLFLPVMDDKNAAKLNELIQHG